MSKNYRAELLACLGDPVDLNPTGTVEEAAFRACGLNWRFLMLRVAQQDLEDALRGCKAMGFRGLGVTMPHKCAIIPLLDGLTPAAEIIGAVNAVYVRDGKWIGDNTDGKGFVGALSGQETALQNRHVTILGAGGAARAIAVECALAGASRITVINRTESKGRELAQLISEKTQAVGSFLPWTPQVEIPSDTDVLVQATCIGLSPNREELPDVDYDFIQPHMLAADVVFDPAHTAFLRQAEQRGAKTVSGVAMLVAQAALAFTGWTGMSAPTDVMEAAMKAELAK